MTLPDWIKDPPWIRQNGEQDHEWRGFCKYRDMEIRVKQDLEPVLGIGRNRIWQIAKKWFWDDRVREYDNHMLQIQDAAAEDELERITREHLRAARTMRELGLRRLENALESGEDVDTREAIALIKEAINTERLVYGEVTERKETKQTWNLEGLSAKEIRELRRLKQRASVDVVVEQVIEGEVEE